MLSNGVIIPTGVVLFMDGNTNANKGIIEIKIEFYLNEITYRKKLFDNIQIEPLRVIRSEDNREVLHGFTQYVNPLDDTAFTPLAVQGYVTAWLKEQLGEEGIEEFTFIPIE